MSFFYFPEDATELIYPFVVLILFFVITILFTRYMIRKNKEDEAKFEEEYKELMQDSPKEAQKNNH